MNNISNNIRDYLIVYSISNIVKKYCFMKHARS